MGEFLGALVAIPLSRRLRVAGLYESMAWLISVAHSSANSFMRRVFFLRQIDWAMTQSKQLCACLVVLLSRPKPVHTKQ
jgi:hypothetical protein